MHFSDYEFGLALGAIKRIRTIEAESDQAISHLSSHVDLLAAELQKARAELKKERAWRVSLQFENDRLNQLLDTPIDEIH